MCAHVAREAASKRREGDQRALLDDTAREPRKHRVHLEGGDLCDRGLARRKESEEEHEWIAVFLAIVNQIQCEPLLVFGDLVWVPFTYSLQVRN